MIHVYNRTLTPLPAGASGRLIEGQSEGDVDESYPPVARALAIGSLVERDKPAPPKAPAKKKPATKKQTATAKTSSKKTTSDSDSEEN